MQPTPDSQETRYRPWNGACLSRGGNDEWLAPLLSSPPSARVRRRRCRARLQCKVQCLVLLLSGYYRRLRRVARRRPNRSARPLNPPPRRGGSGSAKTASVSHLTPSAAVKPPATPAEVFAAMRTERDRARLIYSTTYRRGCRSMPPEFELASRIFAPREPSIGNVGRRAITLSSLVTVPRIVITSR